MSSRLRDNITSGYISAANKLSSKHARQKIVAYVESYDDIFFWRSILSHYEDQHRYFEVMLPSKKRLARGKKSVLMNIISGRVGANMIASEDADYDYLKQGATAQSRDVIDNPYIFHTYAYAIENLQCYAPSLHNVCVSVTLNDHAIFDFQEYLRLYSEAIFPLFVWNIWYYRQQRHDFTITDFNRVVETGNFRIDNPQLAIQNVRRKVATKVSQLQRLNPDAKESYLRLKEEIKTLGVTPQETYLYIQGHHLFDGVVTPMLTKVCDALIREREREIYRGAVHYTQRHNELSGYTHSKGDVTLMLRRNSDFFNSAPLQRLQHDLERMFGKNGS